MIFDDLTIKQLRKLTEQYVKLQKENKLLKAKFPTKLKEDQDPQKTTQEIIDSLPQ